jgi:hypothetical protein
VRRAFTAARPPAQLGNPVNPVHPPQPTEPSQRKPVNHNQRSRRRARTAVLVGFSTFGVSPLQRTELADRAHARRCARRADGPRLLGPAGVTSTWRECRHDHLDTAPLSQLGQGNDAQRPGSSNPAPHRPCHPGRQCDRACAARPRAGNGRSAPWRRSGSAVTSPQEASVVDALGLVRCGARGHALDAGQHLARHPGAALFGGTCLPVFPLSCRA